MRKYIYLIEIRSVDATENRWTPMYNPCYSLKEAKAKAYLKVKIFGLDRVRIAKYEAIEVCERYA